MGISSTFTARILRDGKWFIAHSPEFPEGNGQGLTEEEALQSLRESILLLLEDRREDADESPALEAAILEGVSSPHRPYDASVMDSIRRNARSPA